MSIDWTAPPALRMGCLALITDDDGRVLVVEKDYRTGPARFGLPGGCAQDNESPVDAVRRITAAETGIEIMVGAQLISHYMPREGAQAPGINLVYDAGTLAADARFVLGSGIEAVHWMAEEDIRRWAAPYTAQRIVCALDAREEGPQLTLLGKETETA